MVIPTRYVVRQPAFDRDLLAILGDERRAHDYIEGPEWRLVKDPRSGTLVARRAVEVWKLEITKTSRSWPPTTLLYTFDDRRLVFLRIREAALEDSGEDPGF